LLFNIIAHYLSYVKIGGLKVVMGEYFDACLIMKSCLAPPVAVVNSKKAVLCNSLPRPRLLELPRIILCVALNYLFEVSAFSFLW
jgi:hypothetical protein